MANLYDEALFRELGLADLSAPTDTSFLRDLGLEEAAPPEKEGLDIFQPIRTAFGLTQAAGGALAGQIAPESYEAAKRELAQNLGMTPESPWYEKAEALPGLGDVLAQAVPTGVRESVPGRILGPVARMAGNIVGDPTTYTPFILGKAGNLIAKGVEGGEAALKASQATVRGAEELYRAGEIGRDALTAARGKAAGDVFRAVVEHGSPLQAKAYKAAAVISEIDPIAQGTAAALAYGPQVAESAWDSLKQTLSADSLSEGLVSGANTALMAGLGVLMGKSLVSAAKAKDVLARAVADQSGLKAPGKAPAEPVLPSERVEAPTAPEAPPAEAPVPPEGVGLAEEMVAARDEAAAARPEALQAALEAQQVPRTVAPPEAVGSTIPPEPIAVPRTEALPERPVEIAAPPVEPEVGRVSAISNLAEPPDVQLARMLGQEPKPEAPGAPVDLMGTPEAATALRVTADRMGLSPEQRAVIEARLADPAERAALAQRVQARLENVPAERIPRETKNAYYSLFKELGQEVQKPVEPRVEAPAPVREIPEFKLSEEAAAQIRQIEAARDAALKRAKTPEDRAAISQRATAKIEKITSEELRKAGVEVPAAEPGTIGHRRAGLEAAEREQAVGKPAEVGAAEKVRAEDKRIWGTIPGEERPGVLERFFSAKKGGEIQTKGKDKAWKVDVNLPRMQRFVQLLDETGSREQAVKKLASERKSSAAAERNFVRSFEDSLTEFYAGERGVKIPEKPQAAAAAGIRERKAALDARFPKATEATPEVMVPLLKDYMAFTLERKAAYAQGLSSKDVALRDRRLQEFGTELGLPIQKKDSAQVVMKQIAKRLGLDPKEILAAPQVAAPAPKAGVEKVAPVRFQQRLVGKGVGARTVWVGQGADFERFANGEEFRLTTVKDPKEAIKDLNELVDTPGIRTIHIDPDMKQRDVQKLVDAVVESPNGNTKAAWEVDGERIIPVRKASAEIEAPRIEAAQARKATPDSQLSTGHRVLRSQHYGEDRDAGVDIGDGRKVVDHDRMNRPEYVQRVAEVGKGVSDEINSMVDELSEIHEEGIEFGGLTTSPYLSGLYHDGKLYVNVVEAVHATKTREGAVENLLYTMFHEAAHAQGVGHDLLHGDYARLIKRMAEEDGRFAAYKERLLKALPEGTYKQIRDELVPEFRRKWGEINGESWRKGEQGVPAGDVAGRTQAGADRAIRGAEAAQGGGAPGVQRGGAVPGGALGEAGGVRPTAAAGRGVAEGAAPPEGTGLAVRREAGAEESRIEVLETRKGEGGRTGISLDSGKKLVDDLMGMDLQSKTSRGAMHEQIYSIAERVVDGMTSKEIDDAISALPGGKIDTALNLARYPDLDRRVKAVTKVWYDLTKGKWARDKVEHWEDLGEEVHRLLGLDTPESYMAAIKRKGAFTSQDVVMLRTITNEFGARIQEARDRYYEGMADSKLSGAQKKALEKEWKDASWAYRDAALNLSEASTGVARALAAHKAELIRMDPRLRFEHQALATLREKARQRFPGDAVKAEEKATELFQKLMDVFNKQDVDGRSDQAFAEFRKAHQLLLKRGNWDKTLEWYKMGLLGWPSQIANAGGNALFRMSRFAEDVVAGAIDATRSTLTGKEREVYVGEATAATLGMRRAFAEAWPEMTNEVTRLFGLKGPSLEKALAHMKHGALAEDMLSQAGGAIGGRLGNFVRFQADMMGAADDMGKHIARMDSIYRQVYRKIRKGEAGFEVRPGESKAAAVDRIVSDLRNNHKEWSGARDYDVAKMQKFEPLLKEAEEAALRDTFQETVPGWLRGVQTTIQRNPWMQILVPFFRTPTNIAKETIRRTPLGLLEVAHRWKGMSEVERLSALSRPVTGSLYMLGLAAFAANGDVTGGGPTNPEAQDALKATGWQPYSVRIGNQWISYQRLEPLASLLGFAADYTEAVKRGETGDLSGMAEKAFASITENLTNKTFLSTLTNLSSAISDPQRYGATFLKQLQGSAIPNSIGFIPVGHLARALDPTYRETRAASLSPFMAKIPGASTALAPQYGPTGEERQRKGTFVERLISPYTRSVQEEGPKTVGTEELIRLGAVPKTPMRYWLSPQGVQIPLKPDERQKLAKMMDKAVTAIGAQLVKDPTYRRLPDNENDPNYRFGMKTKEDVVRKMLNRYRYQAMVDLKPVLKARVREEFRKRETT